MPEAIVIRAKFERPLAPRRQVDRREHTRAVLVFASPQIAERLVAGVPAVARAVRAAALAGLDECLIAVKSGWLPGELASVEIERLSGAMRVSLVDWQAAQETVSIGGAFAVSGERLCEVGEWRCAQLLQASGSSALAAARINCAAANLDLAERRILLATAKPQDGLVSRMLNRPISRQISRMLLRWPGMRPIHATMAMAAVALAMLTSLLTGGAIGLLIGALLFQSASILDGVDGEVARATFRASRRGAMLDSLVDAATNVAFIGGLAANLWLAGSARVAAAGLAGLLAMSLGLLLLGLEAARGNGPFTFDVVKDHLGKRPSLVRKWLTWLTMRDFYAFTGFLFVATGHAGLWLAGFAVIASGWLAVVCVVLARRHGVLARAARPNSSEDGGPHAPARADACGASVGVRFPPMPTDTKNKAQGAKA